jgi:hypothetical protein
MATLKETSFMSIPAGVSLTDEPKSRAWLRPPKAVNVSEVAQMYIDKLSSESTLNDLLDVVESGVPLATAAEALMMTHVHQGEHTIDAGIMVMPVIIEMLVTIADIHGAEYVVFGTKPEKTPDRIIRAAIKQARSPEAPEEAAKEKAPKVSLSGLMARKGEQ